MISGPNVQPPVDAAVVKGTDGYEIRPEDNGNTLDEEAVVREVKDFLEKDEAEFPETMVSNPFQEALFAETLFQQ